MFYLARIKADEKAGRCTDISPKSAPFGWQFDEPIDEPLPIVTAVTPKLTDLPDFWRIGEYLFASRRVLDLLFELGETCYETYPFAVKDTNARIDSDNFKIFRFRNHLACMDLEHSEYKLADEGYIDRIRRLVVDEKKIPPGRHFFALAGKPTINLASEELASRWRESRLTGRDFIRLADINYWFG